MVVVESILRWLHVVSALLWVGLLYYFNWVHGPFAATLDGETKKKVLPGLMGRALFWFRYGALYVWISGLMLLGMVFYHPPQMVLQSVDTGAEQGEVFGVALVGLLLLTVVYDRLAGLVFRGAAGFVAGLVAVAALTYGMAALDLEYRAWMIHLGALFGTIMFFNVWMRIWPAQKKILPAIRAGEAPDPALVERAGARSRHNTYLSVPLVLLMLNSHVTWPAHRPWTVVLCTAAAWGIVWLLYKKARTVPAL